MAQGGRDLSFLLKRGRFCNGGGQAGEALFRIARVVAPRCGKQGGAKMNKIVFADMWVENSLVTAKIRYKMTIFSKKYPHLPKNFQKTLDMSNGGGILC